MPHKKKFQLETEIPYELKRKKLTLPLANKWQKYFVEACNKKIEGNRYYAWLKFRTNYRLRKEGWVKAVGQWSVADKNDFADLLWGVWHSCKRRHFPTEVAWLDNFIRELVKIRNGIMIKDEPEEEVPLDAEDLLASPESEEEVEDIPLGVAPPPPAEEDDGSDIEEEEYVEVGGRGMPPAEEDDGEPVVSKPIKSLKRKKGRK